MSRPSSMPEGGKVRGQAATALDATTATFGDTTTPDLLVCDIGAGGELVIGTATGAEGVIYVPEGRRDPSQSNFNDVIGAKWYTLLTFGEIQEFENAGFSAGDKLYAAASGDVTDTPGAGAVYIGTVMPDPSVASGNGLKLFLNVNGLPTG